MLARAGEEHHAVIGGMRLGIAEAAVGFAQRAVDGEVPDDRDALVGDTPAAQLCAIGFIDREDAGEARGIAFARELVRGRDPA